MHQKRNQLGTNQRKQSQEFLFLVFLDQGSFWEIVEEDHATVVDPVRQGGVELVHVSGEFVYLNH